MCTMSLLEAAHLRKTFDGTVAVADVSFHVEAGEVFGLLGPNGAGKSTTLSMLVGLLAPDAGEIRLDGEPFRIRARHLKHLFGMAPQDLAIYPDLTARENLKFFGRLYGVRGKELKVRVDEALERTGLRERADDSVGTFSGGMKRRLNFGVALLHRPRILILDEPTVGVDPQSRAHLLDCFRQLAGEGIATLLTSHYIEEVQAICQRVAIIDHGKVLANDTLDGLLGRMSAAVRLRISEPPAEMLERLEGLVDVRRSAEDGVTTLVLARERAEQSQELSSTLTELIGRLAEFGVQLHSVDTDEPNLETLFLQLTGNRLRD